MIEQSFTQTTYQKIKYEVFEESGAEKMLWGEIKLKLDVVLLCECG